MTPAKFGCFHTVYENKTATEFILQEFRKFHPDAPYTLCGDGGADYSDGISLKDIFQLLYTIFLGKKSGPKLARLLQELDKELVCKLISEAAKL